MSYSSSLGEIKALGAEALSREIECVQKDLAQLKAGTDKLEEDMIFVSPAGCVRCSH